MKVKAVLFDLDGTFVDTAPDLGLALNMQRERHGLPPLPLEVIRPHASHGSRGLLGIGFGLRPEDAEFAVMREEYLGLYEMVFLRQPRLFDGIMEVLQDLEHHRIAWGIVTNKPRRFTAPLLDRLGLARRAASIVSGDDCIRSKPYPDTLLLASQQIGVVPQDCVYVGDARRDIEAGHAAGMKTVVSRYGYLDTRDRPEEWGAEGMIDTPLELLRFLPE